MKIAFNYNNVSPEAVAEILKMFYAHYENEELAFGSIRMYVTVRRKDDNSPVAFTDGEDNREIEWFVKPREMGKTKSPLLMVCECGCEDGGSAENLFVYTAKGKQQV